MPPVAEITAGTILILVVLAALPIAAIAFSLGAGDAFNRIGKGDLSIEPDQHRGGSGGPAIDPESAEAREQDIRQMVQARSDRAVAKGRDAIDVDAEVEKLLASDREQQPPLSRDRGLREEVRGLVLARNERRIRQGKEALDVEEEIDRQLRELENLGQ